MPESSIIVPHYRTPKHLRLCLGLVQHYTPEPHELIVVDNGSEAGEIEFVQEIQNTILVRRKQASMDMIAHAQALDAGVERASGRYVVALHSDSFVICLGWLSFLIDRLENGQWSIVGPDTHKLYPMSPTEKVAALLRRKRETRMMRPLFAAYRAEVLRTHKFVHYEDVGELSVPYVRSGKADFIPRLEAAKYVFHLGGTTRLELLHHRRKAQREKTRRFRKFLERPEVRFIAMQQGFPWADV